MTYQSVLTSISDFSPSSEVATIWQTDGTAHKLKPRSFHKSIPWTSTLVWIVPDSISFSNQGSIYFILNAYSESSQSVLKYLKDTESSIHNIIIMTGDFNIRDCRWNPNYLFHSIYSNSLFDIVDSFSLDISNSIENVPTRFSDNDHNTNSVLDLVFLCPSYSYRVETFIRSCSYYYQCIHSGRKNITFMTFAKGSDEEIQFIKNANIFSFQNIENLKEIVQLLMSKIEEPWQRNLKPVKITRYSKAWWNNECQLSLDKYWLSQSLENWHSFKSTVKKTKWLFFDDKIEEIANKKCGLWELINWVKKQKLPVIEAIQYKGHLCIELEDLWIALHNSFNSAQTWEIDIHVLDNIPNKSTKEWNSFSKQELINVIEKCNNSSALGPDKLTWSHIKIIIRDKDCLSKLIDIANTCIDLGYWPSHFKLSTIVIIPKPNKTVYDLPKLYWPIVLLNTIGKLFEKMIGEHLQFYTISNNFIHQSQLGGLKQRSTTDAGIVLTYIIHSGWVKNLIISTLAFNITQFFPSLNYQLLPLILNKAGLDQRVSIFFKNYLVERKTKYMWNNFIFPSFDINVGIGQGSALSPILSALYLSPVFYSLEKCLKILKIPISMISFVDNGLFVSQSKSFL